MIDSDSRARPEQLDGELAIVAEQVDEELVIERRHGGTESGDLEDRVGGGVEERARAAELIALVCAGAAKAVDGGEHAPAGSTSWANRAALRINQFRRAVADYRTACPESGRTPDKATQAGG